jgi:hypothetical protein
MPTISTIYILLGILISSGAVLPVIAIQKQSIDRIVSLNHFKQVANYHLDKTSIGGINVDMEPAQIIKILGKPRKINEIIRCTLDYTLIYDGLKIVSNGSQSSIRATNSNYRTDLGIKVGDPISKAEKIYDQKLGFRSQKQRGSITYKSIAYRENTRDVEMSLELEIGYGKGRITYIKYERIRHEDC